MKLPQGRHKAPFQSVALLIAALLLSSCSSRGYAPVSEQSIGRQPPPKVYTQGPRVQSTSPQYYWVRPGDTLFSIAFRYGKDLDGLARANDIDRDYTIYPGQRIHLVEARRQASSPRQTEPRPVSSTSAGKKTSTPRKTVATPSIASSNINWGWPASGQVIQKYTSQGKVNKGINLAGNAGDPVYAAADGVVVYAGSGLLGYGNLVILNHNKHYLSAYAHNSKLLVKEQQKVKKGSKIAEVGDSGTTKTMLHFEIRKDGKPVNPLRYLPKR